MIPEERFDAAMAAHRALVDASAAALRVPFTALAEACIAALDQGGKIVFFGNGGSAADSQHLAAELVIRFETDRAPIPAIALTTDTSVLTAGANDIGFDNVFARQIAALCRPPDIAIGISTSGNSPNVIAGLHEARRLGIAAAALSGRDGGALNGLADPLLVVPSDVTARIQEMHILIGHALCDVLERRARPEGTRL